MLNLATLDDNNYCKRISLKAIRDRNSGGFKYCKALGIEIKERNIVQVTMNMVDYTKTPRPCICKFLTLYKGKQKVRYGVNVIGS